MFDYDKLEKYNEKSLNYYGFIYLIVNKINNKFYIGKFQNHRYTNGTKMHVRDYSDYYGSGRLIKQAVEKYGKDNFDRYILEYTFNKEDARTKELYYQRKYNVDKNEKSYNLSINSDGGNTISGYSKEQMDEYKNNMRKKIKDIYDNNYEIREKISTSLKITFDDPEHKKNLSLGQKKRYSKPEERLKTSEKSKAFWDSDKGLEAKNKRKENCIPYYMLNDNFEIIKKFSSCKDALDFLGLKGHMGLNRAIREKIKYRGYYWKKG